jgi:hypothetical protein
LSKLFHCFGTGPTAKTLQHNQICHTIHVFWTPETRTETSTNVSLTDFRCPQQKIWSIITNVIIDWYTILLPWLTGTIFILPILYSCLLI